MKRDREITIELMEGTEPYCQEEDDDEDLFDVRTCRICGCTDDFGCPGGCYWVEDDLCSACVDKAYGINGSEGGTEDENQRDQEHLQAVKHHFYNG